MFTDRSGPEIEWDGDPLKLTPFQLDTMINHYLKLGCNNDPAKMEQVRREVQPGAGVTDSEVGAGL